ncbi:asparagine synthetase [hydrocarbon metagenome]|uniref:Asparagine synthetase n=1 Tax=hydrocarbon metagenome TaxID=938273 RepID=A0A0W8FT15_9ZZZZ
MCGIAGKYYFNTRCYDASDLSQMMKIISHRGPDSSGAFTDGVVAIGFQRLSIIDVKTGDQPLYNETGKIVLVANGEIYNFKELRATLQSSGHIFRTKTDCEVILHLYEEYGKSFVEKLNGMFAFCLYDSEKNILIMARDRMGIKPLYFYQNDNVLIFASEIKGILAARGMSVKPEANVLDEYLCFGSLCNGRTFFSKVVSLDPGYLMEVTKRGVCSQRYWVPEFVESTLSEPQYIERIESSVNNSVKRQMMSDVPLGSLLSGGVDSSWVSVIANKLAPGIKTFTVGFPDPVHNEIPSARFTARSFGFNHHDFISDNKEYADTLEQTIWHHDEPLTFASSVQNRLVCRYARDFVKVVLTGEGADDLFGGYPRQYLSKLQNKFLRLDDTNQRLILMALKFLPVRKIKTLRRFLVLSPYELVLWNAALSEKEKIAWLFDKDEPDISIRIEQLNKVWNKNLDTIDNLLLFDQQTYLRSILNMKDKMSMAESMELRVPTLDNEMISIAHEIPGDIKLRKLQTKYLFKKAAVRHIPRKIVYKKKIGFTIPVDKWLRDKNGVGRFLDMLIDSSDKIEGINKSKLEKVISEHTTGVKNHQNVLCHLIFYVIWRQQYIDAKPLSSN